MSYLHPDYDEWYNVLGGPVVLERTAYYTAYREGDRLYLATEYEDGWFSVEGDEWFGEFKTRAEAEAYLGFEFEQTFDYNEGS